MENSSLGGENKNYASFLFMRMCLAITDISEEGHNPLLISTGSTGLRLSA